MMPSSTERARKKVKVNIQTKKKITKSDKKNSKRTNFVLDFVCVCRYESSIRPSLKQTVSFFFPFFENVELWQPPIRTYCRGCFQIYKIQDRILSPHRDNELGKSFYFIIFVFFSFSQSQSDDSARPWNRTFCGFGGEKQKKTKKNFSVVFSTCFVFTRELFCFTVGKFWSWKIFVSWE